MNNPDDDVPQRGLLQQQGWTSFTPLRTQALAQHGRQPEQTLPLRRAPRSFSPRSGH